MVYKETLFHLEQHLPFIFLCFKVFLVGYFDILLNKPLVRFYVHQPSQLLFFYINLVCPIDMVLLSSLYIVLYFVNTFSILKYIF